MALRHVSFILTKKDAGFTKASRWFDVSLSDRFISKWNWTMRVNTSFSGGAKRCHVDVVDTAFVVKRLSYLSEESGKRARFMVSLSDDTEEELIPGTLYLGEENVLYCRVKGGGFPARFNRAAYYQLAAHIEEEGEGFVLPINGRKFKIGTKDPQSG